jgi:hypothetical protein
MFAIVLLYRIQVALEAFSEAVAGEMKMFNVRVVIVEVVASSTPRPLSV